MVLCRDSRIRTYGLLVPNQARYRTTLYLEVGWAIFFIVEFPSLKTTCDSDWIRTNDPQLRRLLLYPTELRNQIVPGAGVEPARDFVPQDFKSCMSTDFITQATFPQCQRTLTNIKNKFLKTKNPNFF